MLGASCGIKLYWNEIMSLFFFIYGHIGQSSYSSFVIHPTVDRYVGRSLSSREGSLGGRPSKLVSVDFAALSDLDSRLRFGVVMELQRCFGTCIKILHLLPNISGL